ncbi:MAG TPA: hypothetical protein VH573_12845 [Mycobacteriales bacterium]|jgi:hypothetical protein
MLRLFGVRVNPVVGLLLGLAALAVGIGTGRVGVTLAGVVMLLVAATGAVQRRQRPDDRR